MFEEFMGLPAHPLLVHAAVVFIPLLCLLSALYAFVPFTRPHIRWVTAVTAVATPLAALVAKLSGDAFFARLDRLDQISESYYPRLEEHQDLGTMTLYASIGLAVVALALVFLVAPRRTGGAGTPGTTKSKVLSIALGALVVVAAGINLYYVYETGDTGAKAVWEGS